MDKAKFTGLLVSLIDFADERWPDLLLQSCIEPRPSLCSGSDAALELWTAGNP